MGLDKSYLCFQNQTLLDKAYHCLRHAGLDSILVSGRHKGYVCIQDKWPNAGPAAAILSAVLNPAVEEKDYLMVMPVDMPLFPSSLLMLLLRMMETEGCEASFIKNNPLPCCLSVAALKKVAFDVMKPPAISMRTLLTAHLVYQVIDDGFEMQEKCLNINTPEAFFQLRGRNEA